VPKKANRRPVRTKSRPRRVPPKPATPATLPVENGSASPDVMVETAPARPAATTAGRSAAVTRRPGPPPRKVVGITINYAYLLRDLRTLAILDPAMVALVIVAYLKFH
jgi:hypothetical protein